jgi:hypothetical protein
VPTAFQPAAFLVQFAVAEWAGLACVKLADVPEIFTTVFWIIRINFIAVVTTKINVTVVYTC